VTAWPQHRSPPSLLRLQGLLTLFTEFFASFDHSTCALSVPGLYASLRRIHVALRTAVPSHSTPGCEHTRAPMDQRTRCVVRDSLPRSWSVPGLFLVRWSPKPGCPLHSPQHLRIISIESRSQSHSGRAIWDGILPVHSPLLRQSLLLAFPPLSDMLKFGGLLHVHQVTKDHRQIGSPKVASMGLAHGLARGERPESGEVWVGSTLILHFVWVPHCPILQPFREEMVWRDGPCEVEPFRNHLVGMLVYARLVAYVASICWHAPRNRVSDPSFDFSFALLGQGTVSGAQRSRWSPFSHRQHNILAYAHPHSFPGFFAPLEASRRDRYMSHSLLESRGTSGNADARAAQGEDPLAGQLRSELFLCTDHKTLRITEHIARQLRPSS